MTARCNCGQGKELPRIDDKQIYSQIPSCSHNLQCRRWFLPWYTLPPCTSRTIRTTLQTMMMNYPLTALITLCRLMVTAIQDGKDPLAARAWPCRNSLDDTMRPLSERYLAQAPALRGTSQENPARSKRRRREADRREEAPLTIMSSFGCLLPREMGNDSFFVLR